MHRRQQSPPVQESTLKMKRTASLPSPPLPSRSTSHLFLDTKLTRFSKKAEEEVMALPWETDDFSLHEPERGYEQKYLLSQTTQPWGSPLPFLPCHTEGIHSGTLVGNMVRLEA